MSPRIHVLPAELVDQIAAGEVVERPASVVKELCENALDAGARLVEVEIEGGGQRLIRVVDDGSGMTPEEVRLALERHATSKISCAEDLWRLGTMGFRGEALPSIASVSRLAITSRAEGEGEGWRLEVDAGAVGEGRPAGAPRGTTVEVRDLLGNVPARRKFLKADATETAHASEAVLRLALAHPAVHLRLRSGEEGGRRVLVDLPPHGSLLERARVGLGRKLPARLHGATGEESGIRVTACLGSPMEAGSTSRGTYLMVNRRFVRDRGLLHAVVMGYGEILERGRYPLAVVHLDVRPDVVDVNVHPQKTEVRFARPQEVFAAVRHLVQAACAKAPWLEESVAEKALKVYSLPPQQGAAARERGPAYRVSGEEDEEQTRMSAALELFMRPREGASATAATTTTTTAGAAAPAVRQAQGFFAGLAYLGQLHKTYLICQAPGELVLIDQHAAHERVAFERLRAAHRRRQMPSQRLLFPSTLELDAQLGAVAEEESETLFALGFDVEPFGGTSFAVKAVPEGIAPAELDAVLVEILEKLKARDGEPGVQAALGGPDQLDHVLATMACHSVVRAGDVLDERRARALLESMDGIDFRAHCPHGRPVLLRMSLGEIERRFGRT